MSAFVLLVCLLGTSIFVEGYVELESFDLDLEIKELVLSFSTSVDPATFDPTTLTFIDDDQIPLHRFALTGGTANAVNGTIVSVGLVESDVEAIVSLPGLCIAPSSCFLLYGNGLIKGRSGETTLPGRAGVSGFVPYPLFFSSFTLDLDSGHLALTFNKNVTASSVNPTALTFYGTNDTSTEPSHTVLSADCVDAVGCVDGPSVVVILSQDDLNSVKSTPTVCTEVSDCFILVNTSLITDLGGYPIREGVVSRATNFVMDTTPPNLVGVGLDFSGNGTIYLQFDEAVNPSTFALSVGQLMIKNPASRNYTYDVGSAGPVRVVGAYNISTVVAIAADGILDNMKDGVLRSLLLSTTFSSSAGIIRDYSDLAIVSGSGIPLYLTVGGEALTLKVNYEFVFDMESQSFRVTFPCSVPDRFSGGSFTFLNNERSITTQEFQMTDDYYGGYGNDLVFYLTDDAIREIASLPDIGTSISNTFVLISESFCGERGQLLVQATEVTAATRPLELVAYTVDLSESKLVLTFDSLLGETVNVSQITLQKEETSTEDSHNLALSSYTVLDWRVDVKLAQSDLNTLKASGIAQSISTSFLAISSSVAMDIYGNGVNEVPSSNALAASRFIAPVDPQPTTLQSFAFFCDSGHLQLNFSQLVYTATLDLTKAMLMNERGDTFTLFDGQYTTEYTSTVDVTINPDAISAIRSTPGFLVSSSHIYLKVTEALVYDVNDLLLNVDNDTLMASSAVACPCVQGYRLDSNMTDCTDVDECLTNPCDHNCNNTIGSYFCFCDEGYYLESDKHNCTDINECETIQHNCSQMCVNDPGSYHCQCNTTEYVLLSDGKTCMAIDHCNISDHGCSDMCVDDFGEYRCLCPPGYRLMDDERTCEDINECSEGVSGCEQNCTNTPGQYSCFCMGGYTLDDNEHTCTDINECMVETDNCQEFCNNAAGGFSCHCRPGYTLQENGYQCVADDCESTLVAPPYGNISCYGDQVTDNNCSFTCQPGFSLRGSVTRGCLSDHTWSGDEVLCERKRCPSLAFSDAVINNECDTLLGSTCYLTCSPDYFNPSPGNNSMTCVVTSEEENTVGWTTRPICQKREPCLPTPCLHNAPCSEIQTETGMEPQCDCTGTGYSGDRCGVGVVTVPDLPLLTVGTSHTITLTARPDNDLTITLITQVPVSPQTVSFDATKTSANVQFTPDASGIFSLEYRLSGTNDFVFTKPLDASVIVYSGATPNIDPILKPSCCENTTRSVHTCSNGGSFSIRSTCRQSTDTWPAQTRILQGVSFSVGGGLSVPISLRSVTMVTSGLRQLSYSLTPYDGTEVCTSCEDGSNRDKCSGTQFDCSCFSSGPDAIATFIRQESLAMTYLDGISGLLPSWMKLEAISTGRTAYADTSLNVALVDAEEMVRMDQCRGFYRISDSDFSTYSVLLYSGTMRVTVGESSVEYSPQGNEVVCIAVSLCDGGNSPVLISLPEGFPYEMLEFAQRLMLNGWLIEDLRGVIVNIKSPIAVLGTQPDAALYGKLNYFGDRGPNNINFMFEGLVGVSTEVDMSLMSGASVSQLSAVLVGRTSLQLNSSGQVLQLQEVSAMSHLNFTSTAREDSSCNRHGTLHSTLSQWAVRDTTNVFNKLFSDGGSYSCPVDVELLMDERGQLDDLVLTTSCYKLQSGNLVFGGLVHSLHLLHTSSAVRCKGEVRLPEGATERDLLLLSRFQQSGRIPSLWFLELVGSKGDLAVTTLINTNHSTFTGRTTPANTTLQLFGDPQSAEVQITDSLVQFEATIEVLGSESSVVAMATADRPGAPPTLHVAGRLQGRDFQSKLESTANSFISQESQRTPNLEKLLEDSLNSASLSLREEIEVLMNASQTRRMTADEAYRAAREFRQMTDIMHASLSNQVALDRGRYRSSDLVTSLESLCEVKESCMRDNLEALVCAGCMNLPVKGRRLRFGSTYCNRTLTLEDKTTELVDRYRSMMVRGPELSELLCDASGVSIWTDPSRGCRVVTTLAEPRYIWERSQQMEEVVRYLTVNRMESCEGSIPEDYTWELDHFCCDTLEDTNIHNSDCLSESLACFLARQLVYETSLSDGVRDFSDLLKRLDEALINRTTAEVAESIRREELRAAEKENGHLMQFHLFLSDLIDMRRAKYTEVKTRNRTVEETSVTINNISFSLNLFSKPATLIPLEIAYSTPGCSDGVVNFDFYVSSVESSIIDASVLLARAAVGGACPQREKGSSNYNLYCKNLLDMYTAVGIVSTSLETIRLRYVSTQRDVTDLSSNLTARSSGLRTWPIPQAWHNSTAAQHVQLTGISDQITSTPLYTSFHSLTNVMAQAAQNANEFVDRYVFIRWLLHLESEVEELFEDYNCSGLAECLLRVEEVAERLLLNANTDWSKQLLEELPPAVNDLKNIVEEATVRSVSALKARLSKMEAILSSMIARDYWCEQIQDVTVQADNNEPIPLTNTTQDVTFTCSSTSQYPAHYQWLKDGVAIPGETNSILTLQVSSVDVGGVYSCDVQSHRGDEVTTSQRLVVHSLPTLTLTPVNHTVSEEAGPIFFRCNATGTPDPTWQWYFRTNDSSSPSAMVGEVRSELMVLPSSLTEGYYMCEASNVRGSVRSSTGGQLHVLQSTISRSGRSGMVGFAPNTNPRSRRSPGNVVLSQNLTQILVHFLFSNSSSVQIEDGTITVNDQSQNIELTFNIVSGELTRANSSEGAQQTLRMITASLMEFDMVVSLIDSNLANDSIIDYRSLGIDYSNVTLAVVDASTIVSVCPDGQELQRDTNLFCVSCPPGTRQTVASEALSSSLNLRYSRCEACPLGHAQPSSGQQTCLPCTPGAHQPTLGGVECRLCAMDEYQDEEGQFVCKSCPTGTGISFNGATSADNCTCTVDCEPTVSPVILGWIAAVVIFAVIAIGLVIIALVVILCKMQKGKKMYDLQRGTNENELEDIVCIPHKQMVPEEEERYEGVQVQRTPEGNVYVNPLSPLHEKDVTMETNFGDTMETTKDEALVKSTTKTEGIPSDSPTSQSLKDEDTGLFPGTEGGVGYTNERATMDF